jgi:SAM-dependent methyltransferase
MLGSHIYDPDFLNSSHSLKKVLFDSYNIPMESCLDIPCGNGRNIFLLASFFKNVVGVDINQEYLNNIRHACPDYVLSGNSISTRQMDLITDIPNDINDFDFIATIHYYNYSLANGVISNMKKGAFFYIETQTCAGGNYIELPTEKEVEFLLTDTEVVFYKSNFCNSPNLKPKSISFKVLIRKSND